MKMEKEMKKEEPVKMDDMFIAWQIVCIAAFVGFSCLLYYSIYGTFIVSRTTTYQLAAEIVPYELRAPGYFIGFSLMSAFLLTIAFSVTILFIRWKEWCSTTSHYDDLSTPGVYISIAIFTIAASIFNAFITYEGCRLYLKAIATGNTSVADLILFLVLAGIPFIAFGCWFRHALRQYNKAKKHTNTVEKPRSAGERLFRFLALSRSRK